MRRMLPLFAAAIWLGMVGCALAAEKREVWDLKEAMADPDFHIQGEYIGEGMLPGVGECRVGAQVIARGGGKFEIYLLGGGLPGDGWKRGDPRVRMTAETVGGVVKATGENLEGQIKNGVFTITCKPCGKSFTLKRIERKSPTLGAKPPKGAIVLYDGTSLENFPDAHKGPEGSIFSGTTSKPKFNDYTLHLEFRLTWMPNARGQARSNSGVYLHDCYEVQVLDSFGLEGRHNECGGIYSIKDPDVNMCFPPMTWQTYDIEFTAPRYDESGKKIANARITVRHNGVVIHKDFELPHDTPGRQKEGPGPRPIHLQGHGCHVHYRNIWVVPKD